MQVSKAPTVRVAVFIDGDETHISKEIQKKLIDTYMQCVELKKAYELKGEILFAKIQKLVPEAPIPSAFLQIGKRDDLFQTTMMFTDMCRHVHDCSIDWNVHEEIFSHHRFKEIDQISELLLKDVQKAMGRDELTEDLIKAIKNVAYLPCKRKLGPIQAKEMLPRLSEKEQQLVYETLQTSDQIENYYQLTNTCRKIIAYRKKGEKDTKQVRALYTKASNLLAVIFSLCRDHKIITDTAQDMINEARKAEPPKSWLW